MIIIIDYGDKNTRLVAEALKKLTSNFEISDNELKILKAEKIILPGEGDASDAVRRLHVMNLFSILRMVKKPVLGIGLGMQLMANFSKDGNVSCLGIFPGSAEEFKEPESILPNKQNANISMVKPSKLLKGVGDSDKFYFKHNFYLPKNNFTTSVSSNGIDFSSSMEKDNCYGVQFHPESSGEAGLKIFRNFIEIE